MHYRNTIPKSQRVNTVRHARPDIGTSILSVLDVLMMTFKILNHMYIVNDNCNKYIQIKFVTTNSIFLSTLN